MARRTTWIDTLMDLVVVSGGQEVLTLSSQLSALQTRGRTIVRMIMCYSLCPNNFGVVDGIMRVDVGVGMFDQEAFAVESLPDPDTRDDQPGNGWMYRCQHLVLDRDDIAGQSLYQTRIVEVNRDLRAMRKVDGREPGIIFDSNIFQGVGFTVQISGIVRLLMLEP